MHYRANFNDIELTIEYDVSRLLILYLFQFCQNVWSFSHLQVYYKFFFSRF